MIQVLQLRNGREIIGRMTETETHYNITQPMAIEIRIGDDQRPQISLTPFPTLSTHKKELPLPKDIVLFPYEPVEDLSNLYTQATSGLIMPSSGDRVGKQLIKG